MALLVTNRWGDTSHWGDGDLWDGENLSPVEYIANKELQCHRLSVKLTKTGSTNFVLHNLVARLSRIRQGGHTHMAYIDEVTPSRHLSIKVKHTGSEFILSYLYLLASRKKHQPRG